MEYDTLPHPGDTPAPWRQPLAPAFAACSCRTMTPRHPAFFGYGSLVNRATHGHAPAAPARALTSAVDALAALAAASAAGRTSMISSAPGRGLAVR